MLPVETQERHAVTARYASRTYFSAYQLPATGNVQRVGMNYLSDLVIRPGIEKTFGPLLLYRGAMNRGHAHRLWNMTLLMMAAECETLSDGLKVLHNPDFSQLCGPVRAPGKMTLNGYFGRLHDNPAVTKNIEGLTDYVRMMGLGECRLTRVDRFSDEPTCAEWRISRHPDKADHVPAERGIPQKEQLFYPYIRHDAAKREGDDLVLAVNQAVSTSRWPMLPDHIRADACQDMIVAVLTGEIGRDQIEERAAKFIGRVFGENNWKFGPISLEKPLTHNGGDPLRLQDTIADGFYERWTEAMEAGDA